MWIKGKFKGKQKASETTGLASLVRKEGWSPAACEIVCPTHAMYPGSWDRCYLVLKLVPVLATRQHRLAEKVQQISFVSLDGLTEEGFTIQKFSIFF